MTRDREIAPSNRVLADVETVARVLDAAIRPASLRVLGAALGGAPAVQLVSRTGLTRAQVARICRDLVAVGVLSQRGSWFETDAQELVALLPFGDRMH